MKKTIKWISRALIYILVALQLLLMCWQYKTMKKVEWMEKEYELIDSVFDITPNND